MKMKNALMMLCSILLITACGSDDDDYTKLSVDLKDLSLSFTAQATESFTVTVDTDQETWDVQSDKSWCKVEKASSRFVVTAEPNETEQAPETATIAVTATGAKPILIKVTQAVLTTEEREQMLYDKYVTAEMKSAITKLKMPVNRGINPPKIEGYYRMKGIFLATTNSAENSYLGINLNDYKFSFYNQSGLSIDLLGYEVKEDTDMLSTEHLGQGTFICGEGDKFSIFMEEQGISDGYTSVVLTIISGEVVRSGGNITGMKDLRYAFIMKDRGGNPSVIQVGQGRVVGDDEISVITKEQFEKLVRSASLKSSNLDLTFGI